MNANHYERDALIAAGYSFEYPGYWSKVVGDKEITIADGISDNGHAWEVQIMQDGVCIVATKGFANTNEAIAMAQRELTCNT